MFFNSPPDDPFKQLPGALFGFTALPDDVVVDKEYIFLRHLFKFIQHILNRPETVMLAVECRHAAKTAVHRTATGSLDPGADVGRVKKIPPRLWLPDLPGKRRFIEPLQHALLKIPDHLRPDGFCFTLDDGVNILHALLRDH